MIYRKLDLNGDYSFGQKNNNFLVNSPDAVAQAVKTRLGLIQGEWFLNINEGVPYNTQILGFGNMLKYDFVIQEAVLNTQGVNKLLSYNSQVNTNTRKVSIQFEIDTVYGAIKASTIL